MWKIRLKWVNLLFVIIICNACDDNSPVELEDDKEMIKKLLSEMQLEDDLIVNLIDDNLDYHLQFESNEQIQIPKSCITSVEVVDDEWHVVLIFNDGTQFEFNIIGENISTSNYNIDLDPSGSSPLSALLNFNTHIDGRIAVKILGQDGELSNIESPLFENDSIHSIPILGMYPDFLNSIEISFYNDDGVFRSKEVVNIQTNPLPINFEINVIENRPSELDQSVFVDSDKKVGFDKFGKVRWYHTSGGWFLRRAKSGQFIILVSGQVASKIKYTDLLGNQSTAFQKNEFVHHDVIETPYNTFLITTNGSQDIVQEVDIESGNLIREIKYSEILDPDRTENFLGGWSHMNALFFDESDNSIIASIRHQNAVVKIDYNTTELKWILGPHDNWTEDFTPFLFEPINFDSTEWNWGQHAAMRMPNGNILLYNNGNYRSYDSNEEQTYTNAVEYDIDEENMTVVLNWEYGKERNFFCKRTGDVDYFPQSGNKLIGFTAAGTSAETPRVIELDANDNVLFEAVYDVDVDHYRVEKVDLYGQ